MPVIRHPSSLYTVIVSVDAEAHVMPDLERHARAGLALFHECRGFVAGALHRSGDGKRLIQYLQWETESLYNRCISDDRWNNVPTTKSFMKLIETGQAHVDARGFEVLATS